MEVVRTAAALRRALRAVRGAGGSLGLVPTMGALHAGHRSLVARARADGRHVVLTVFVNPLQFDRPEDLDRYPRDLARDLAAAETFGAGTVFAPPVEEMFAASPRTSVSVRDLTEGWEGASRPGHFDGVATVVAKLFSLVGECAAYFGEKDYQQLVVVRTMAADLSMPVDIVGCPTAREADGLACSSRNALLDGEQRRVAMVLWRALGAGRDAVAAGEVSPAAVSAAMEAVFAGEPAARLDYAAAVDPATLSVPPTLADLDEARLLVAAWIGRVRLIDNSAAAVGHNR